MQILPAFVISIIISTVVLAANVQIEVSAQTTPTSNEHFFINKEFWAFGGRYVIGSFSANSGDYLTLAISSINIDPDRPDDKYIVDLELSSVNYGTFHIDGTQFNQRIILNDTDYYTITASKHQFYSSIRISGEIIVYHDPAPFATDSPSKAPTTSPTKNPDDLPNPSSSATPTVPEISFVDIAPLLVITVIIILVKKKIYPKTNN